VAIRDLRARRQAEAEIRFLAYHDPLTGLPNRTSFAARLDQHRLLHQRTGAPFAVLSVDLDRFKMVNDTLGHPIGDALLQQVADRLRSATRGTDVVARLGGDEFSILQTDGVQPEAATTLAARLVELLARPFVIEGNVVNVGGSIGIALAPVDGDEPAQLVKCADLALYRAKLEGRGTFRFFEPEMDARMQERRALELDLRRALALDEFELHYQPQLAVRNDALVGCEALIRWRHPQRGLVPPAEFIPLAEETGLIVAIGEWVLVSACREAARWPATMSIAVNLSPAQFKGARIVETVGSALARAELPAHRLELEITESLLLQNNAANHATLHRLRDLGIRISMDDFGTGYSSLSYLRSFPFDKIKIDRSFIRELTVDPECHAIVVAVLNLGRSLKIATTAEGVETAEQLDRLRHDGCDEIQGYLISRPLRADEVDRLLQERAELAA
jgi:diguanylate cyclase (GGDEF)-like protein